MMAVSVSWNSFQNSHLSLVQHRCSETQDDAVDCRGMTFPGETHYKSKLGPVMTLRTIDSPSVSTVLPSMEDEYGHSFDMCPVETFSGSP